MSNIRKIPALMYTINHKHFENGDLDKMLYAGITAFRINLGRTSAEDCNRMCEHLKNESTRLGMKVFIEIDLPGAKARIVKGTKFLGITANSACLSYNSDGDLCTDADWFIGSLRCEDVLQIGRSGVQAKVVSLTQNQAEISFVNSGEIKSRDSIKVVNRKPEVPLITQKDAELIKKISSFSFDCLAVSFAESAHQIESVRKLLESQRGYADVKIIAKIENITGIQRLEQISAVADGILVGRGDLSEAIGMEQANSFIDKLLDQWTSPEKILMLATYYFLDYLSGKGQVDPAMKKQESPYVNYFITDESSYNDWKKIYDVYSKGDF